MPSARALLLLATIGAAACAPAPPTARHPDRAEPISASGPRSEDRRHAGAEAERAAAPPIEVETRTLEALDAIVREGLIVLVEPDGAHVRAVEVESGRPRWRRPTGAAASAAVIHDLGAGRALVQVPRRFVTIDLASGRRLASREAPHGWRFVFRNAGACALNGGCDFTPIACDDGRPLGDPLLISSIQLLSRGTTPGPPDLHDEALGSSSGCTGVREVIGRAGDLSLYLIEPESGGAPEVIAIDDGGAIRWRRADVACASCAPVGLGASSDGGTCWTTDRTERELVVRAFDCASGQPRFARRLAMGAYRHPPLVTGWLSEPPGLVISMHERVALIAPDGRTVWERADIPASTLAVPEGLRVSSYPLALDSYDARMILRPTDGATLRTDPAAGGEVRVHDGRVAILPAGGSYDRGGAPVDAPQRFVFERARTGSRALVDGRAALTLEGDGWVLGEHRSDAGAWIVIAEPRDGAPDRLYVLRAP